MKVYLHEKQIILACMLQSFLMFLLTIAQIVTTESIHLIIWIPVMHNWRVVVKKTKQPK